MKARKVMARFALCAIALATAYSQAAPTDTAETLEIRNTRLAARSEGEVLYNLWCGACHGPGQHTPGTAALAFKYGGDRPGLLTERTDLTKEIIVYFTRNGVSVMAPFRKTEITDAELDLIAGFITQSAAAHAQQPASSGN